MGRCQPPSAPTPSLTYAEALERCDGSALLWYWGQVIPCQHIFSAPAILARGVEIFGPLGALSALHLAWTAEAFKLLYVYVCIGPVTPQICVQIATHARLKLQDWADSRVGADCDWADHICAYAASSGNLPLLVQARAANYPWDWRTYLYASEQPDCGLVEWARAQNPPCPWMA